MKVRVPVSNVQQTTDMEAQYLLLKKENPIELHPLWQSIHFLGFFTGGTTFILGTSCYYYPDWAAGGWIAGWLYIIGSIGFLSVDVLEFFTFTEEFWLRLNISMSAFGSSLYIAGSVGFLPSIFDVSETLGTMGFIFGSLFIGLSQCWKVHRIGSNSSNFKFSSLISSKDLFTQTGVEASAGLGAWCFFIGTIMFVQGPLEGSWYESILFLWMCGSTFFTMGSLFLFYRHAIMHLRLFPYVIKLSSGLLLLNICFWPSRELVSCTSGCCFAQKALNGYPKKQACSISFVVSRATTVDESAVAISFFPITFLVRYRSSRPSLGKKNSGHALTARSLLEQAPNSGTTEPQRLCNQKASSSMDSTMLYSTQNEPNTCAISSNKSSPLSSIRLIKYIANCKQHIASHTYISQLGQIKPELTKASTFSLLWIPTLHLFNFLNGIIPAHKLVSPPHKNNVQDCGSRGSNNDASNTSAMNYNKTPFTVSSFINTGNNSSAPKTNKKTTFWNVLWQKASVFNEGFSLGYLSFPEVGDLVPRKDHHFAETLDNYLLIKPHKELQILFSITAVGDEHCHRLFCNYTSEGCFQI
eukprot:gene3270-6473_t